MTLLGIHAVKLSKVYCDGSQSVTALRPVTFHVDPGEVLCVTGRSGSGKSTLLRLLAGIEQPTSGELVIAGTKVDASTERHVRTSLVSLVFQDYNLIPELTASENIQLARHLRGLGGDHEAIGAALEVVGMADMGHRFPAQLSGGEQQRVAIARTLAIDSPVVLADEPTGALDEGNARAVAQALIASARDKGVSVVVATHDPLVIEIVGNAVSLSRPSAEVA